MKIEYHNLYAHIILITKNRFPFIEETNRIRIEKYITGIVSNHSCRLYAIYANPEHVHMLISRSPLIPESELASRIAESTLRFIQDNKLCHPRFAWQDSASAFSVSKTDVDRVCKYILNQKEHHRKVTFKVEFDQFMKHYQQTLRWKPAA